MCVCVCVCVCVEKMSWIWQNVRRKGKTKKNMLHGLFIYQCVSTSIFFEKNVLSKLFYYKK